MTQRLQTATVGSRLAIILTTVIVTTVVLAGGVALATVGLSSVGSPQIKNGSIRSVDIGNGQVKSADIATNAVRASDIAADAVRSGDIKNGTVTSADIADNAVRGLDIRDGTITSSDIANGTVTGVDLAAAAQPAGVAFADGNQTLGLSGLAQSVRSVVLDAPAPGHVIVTASATTELASGFTDRVRCSITDGPIALDFDHEIVVDDFGVAASQQFIPLSGTRTFAVPAGPTTFRLVCDEDAGVVVIIDSQITALYVPARYTP